MNMEKRRSVFGAVLVSCLIVSVNSNALNASIAVDSQPEVEELKTENYRLTAKVSELEGLLKNVSATKNLIFLM